VCKNKHEFESWFSESQEYEKLSKKKLLECIYCGSINVKKNIMSPRILSGQNKDKEKENKIFNKEVQKAKNDFLKLRKFVEKNFEFVGDRFADRVRDVYYDKKSNKNIYGSTTQQEREELKEEGINLTTIPWVEKEN
tara:strand:- start:750 stop:1160 length:411 start_codon:yes stop_codon:yes gene_type:complete